MSKQKTIEPDVAVEIKGSPIGDLVSLDFNPMAQSMQMLHRMIETKADPVAIKAGYDLVKEIKDEMARMAYNSSMIACQSEMPIVYKDAKNPHAKADFASIENIHMTCKPTWLKHGFALSFTEAEADANGDMIVMRCDVQHKDGFVKSHFGRYPRDGKGAKGGGVMNDLQGTVSAHSYAERDMTTLIFNIVVAGRDKDGVSPGASVTQEQIHEMNTLIDVTRDKGIKHDHRSFLAMFGVEDLDQMNSKVAVVAINMLKKKAGVE